jgi:1-acyl-sn-glycerol-3-phosphate acyltransferase
MLGRNFRQDGMKHEFISSDTALVALDSTPVRVLKRAALIIVGPIYFLFITFIPLLCGRRDGFRGWYWRTIKRAASRLLWLLSIRTDISDADLQALAEDTDSIIVVNHRSHLDGFALLDIIPDEKWVTFAAKKELCDTFLLKTGFKGAGLIEIDRSSGRVAMMALGRAVRGMEKRRSVVLFAEGTRTKTKSLGPFKAGAVFIARQTGRTIRPIVIHDSDRLMARDAFVPKSGTLRIDVLPPFTPDKSLSTEADIDRLRDQMVAVFDED